MSVRRNVGLFYWFNFFADFRLYAPVAIIYFAQVAHSFALGMAVFSAATISAAIFEVPTGIYSDFVGRKKTIIFGALVSVFSVIFYATGIFSFWLLVIGAIFEGLARSFHSGNNEALLYDSLAEENLQEHYAEYSGKIGSMFQLALGMSGLIGGLIATRSLQIVFWISVIPQLLCLLLSLFFIEPQHFKKESTNIYSHLKEAVELFKNNIKLRNISIASILSFGIGESMWLFRGAFIKLFLPIWALGAIQALANMGATLSFYFSGKLIKKFGEFKILLFSSIYGRVLDFITFIFPSVFTIGTGTSGSLLFGVSVTAQGNLLQKEFTPHQRATLGSLNSFGGSLFFGVFSILLGFVADRIGPVNALIAANILLIAPGIIYWRILKRAAEKM